MLADPPIEYGDLGHATSLITLAHKFFATAVTEWLDEPGHEPFVRAAALANVLTQSLQLVVIGLGPTRTHRRSSRRSTRAGRR